MLVILITISGTLKRLPVPQIPSSSINSLTTNIFPKRCESENANPSGRKNHRLVVMLKNKDYEKILFCRQILTERRGRGPKAQKAGKEIGPHLVGEAEQWGWRHVLYGFSQGYIKACFPWEPHITLCLETEHPQEASAHKRASGAHQQPLEYEKLDTGEASGGRWTQRQKTEEARGQLLSLHSAEYLG